VVGDAVVGVALDVVDGVVSVGTGTAINRVISWPARTRLLALGSVPTTSPGPT
jgi:hypothetical protein